MGKGSRSRAAGADRAAKKAADATSYAERGYTAATAALNVYSNSGNPATNYLTDLDFGVWFGDLSCIIERKS